MSVLRTPLISFMSSMEVIMSIKNILVAYNGSKGAEQALAFACLMAQKFDADLTGILTHGLPTVLYSYGSHLPQAAMYQLEEADREHRGEVRKTFHTATTDMPSDRIHFLDVYGDADEKLMEVARCYDLVIMGAADSDSDFPHMEVHPDVVARNSGRPVMIVPRDYVTEELGDMLLFAWDGRRAAARAISDAMKLIEDSSKVSVLSIEAADEENSILPPMVMHLERHGLNCTAISKPREGKPIAECILDTAKEVKAGILVMGAYEHSKFAEDLFGGVTNSVLKNAKVPVLLAH